MVWQWSPYIVPLLVAAAVSAALAVYAWQRRPTPGATWFALLMLAVAEWSLTYALELSSSDLSAKVLWVKVEYVGIVTLPVAWLAFALQYTGHDKWLTPRNVILLALAPLAVLLLVWTNESHHLFYAGNGLDVSGTHPVIPPTYGPWFWVHVSYSYLLLTLGLGLIARRLVRAHDLHRGQWIAVLIGLLMPWMADVVSAFVLPLGFGVHLGLDLTPFAFVLTGLSATWGLLHFRLLDIVPIAREMVIERMDSGVIVLDVHNRVVDLNAAAGRIVGSTPSEAVGSPAAEVLSGFQLMGERLGNGAPTDAELWLGEGSQRRSFELRVTLLRDRRDRLVGRLLLLHDVTDRKRAEETLLRRNRELILFNHAGQAFTSTLELNQVLATVLEEVRRVLNVAICSIWLEDPTSGELVCQEASGPKSEMVRGWRLAPGSGVTGWVFRNDRGVIVNDTRVDERHYKGVDERTEWESRSILSVPLRIRERVIGTLDVTATEADRFISADMALIESLAATAAIAIENARLYDQARQDVETKAVLLREVNHRVRNNLSAIVGLLYAQLRHGPAGRRKAYQAGMQDLIARVQGMVTVHQMLSASEWSPLRLSDLVAEVISASLQTLPPEKTISVHVSSAPVRVTPDQASSLAMILGELAANTIKHGLAGRSKGSIETRIELEGDQVMLEYRDDGPGYPEKVCRLERHGVGLYLITRLVNTNLRGTVRFDSDQGTVTTICFPSAGSGAR